MKKKGVFTILILTMLFALTGCLRGEQTINYNVNGTYTVNSMIGIRADAAEEDMTDEGMVLKTIDGVDYYVQEEIKTYLSKEEFEKDAEGIVVGDGIFYYDLSSSNSEQSEYDMDTMVDYMSIIVNMQAPITNSNGIINGNSVKFEYKGGDTSNLIWYAYTENGNSSVINDKEAPIIGNIKEGYHYNKLNTISVTDNVALKSVKLNNKDYTQGTVPVQLVQGKNTIIAVDLNGNVITKSFYYDTKSPVLKGVKNGKLYKKKVTVYVKDTVALKKLKDNSKTLKLKKVKTGKYKGYSKVTIKKKGTHKLIAYDKAGNKKVIKIKIK